jgi:hypothetical protein
VSAEASIATPSGTYEQIASASASIDDLRGEWAPVVDVAGKLPLLVRDGTVDPSIAVELMMKGMPLAMSAFGVKGTPAEIAAYAQGVAPEAIALLKGNPKPIAMVAVKLGAAYGCNAVGIPPEVGFVTVEAIKDLELTDRDFEAFGALGGAVGGATVCSLIGVPPSIGGFVGGIAGKAAGGAIASVAGIGGGKAEREARKQKMLEMRAQARGTLSAVRNIYADAIALQRGAWWGKFDAIVESTSTFWQNFECEIGTRFPLLFQGGIGFQGHNATVTPFFVNRFDASRCIAPVNKNLSRGTGCLMWGSLYSYLSSAQPWPMGGCPSALGCPYPDLPTRGASDEWSARVIKAFAAYDIWWQPGAERQAIDAAWIDALPRTNAECTIENVRSHMARTLGPTSYEAYIGKALEVQTRCKSTACKNTWTNDINWVIKNGYQIECEAVTSEALSLDAINAAGIRIARDITTTAATYGAAQMAYLTRAELLTGKLAKAVAGNERAGKLIIENTLRLKQAYARGRVINGIVNYGALALGAGLVTAAALKVRSR